MAIFDEIESVVPRLVPTLQEGETQPRMGERRIDAYGYSVQIWLNDAVGLGLLGGDSDLRYGLRPAFYIWRRKMGCMTRIGGTRALTTRIQATTRVHPTLCFLRSRSL